MLGLTLYFESSTGSPTLYTDFAQVFMNIYQLQTANPNLDSSLHLPTGSFINVVQSASNVWSAGNLSQAQYNNLDNVLDGSIAVGQQNASACNQLMLGLEVSQKAQGYLDGSQGLLPGGSVSSQTYWFYTGDNDPVKHQYWNTTTATFGGFAFESLVRPRTQRPTGPRPRPRPRVGPQWIGSF